MKKSIILLTFLIFTLKGFAQIIEEHMYEQTLTPPYTRFEMIKLHSGTCYVQTVDNKVTLYGLNHSIFIEFNIPQIEGFKSSIGCISDKLFNLDDKVEFLINYTDQYSKPMKTAIINEDYETLFSKDDVNCQTILAYSPFSLFNIYSTEEGWKMTLSNQSFEKIYVYSLPGTLPGCCEEEKVTTPVNKSLKLRSAISNPFPNPTSESTRIEFELPKNETSGELVVYNKDGAVIKKYKVDRSIGYLQLNNSDLPSGTYYYNLVTSSGTSDTKKMLVIK